MQWKSLFLILTSLVLIFDSQRLSAQERHERQILEYVVQGDSHFYKKNYSEALDYYTRAMALVEKPSLDMGCAQLLLRLGSTHRYLAQYDTALAECSEGADILNRIGSDESDEMGQINNMQGILMLDKGDFGAARKHFQKSAAIFKKLHGEKYDEYIASVYCMGNACERQGNYAEALGYFQQAAALYKQVLGTESSKFAQALNSIGLTFYGMADFDQASAYFQAAASIWKRTQGADHPDYATALSNIGLVRHSQGDYAEAMKFFTLATDIQQKAPEADNREYASTLSNMGSVCLDQDDYSGALKYYRQAAAILKEASGMDRSEYVNMLNNIGTTCSEQSDYPQALDNLKQAAEVCRQVLGTDHPIYASILNNTGLVYDRQGNYTAAMDYYMQAVKIVEKALGAEHPQYVVTINNIALSMNRPGATSAKAVGYARQLLSLVRNQVNRSFSYMTEREREAFWNKNSYYIDNIYAIATVSGHAKSAGDLLFDACLTGKGLLLGTSVEIDKLIAESGNAQLAECSHELRTLRKQLGLIYQKPAAERPAETPQMEIRADSLEKTLLANAREYGDYMRNLNLGWQDVARNLGEKDAAVEFVLSSLAGKSFYTAVVLRRNREPQLIPLFEDKRGRLAAASKAAGGGLYDEKTLFKQIWNGITDCLHPGDNVYFSPAGALHQIGIEYLPIDDSVRMCDRYNMVRLSSTRQLALGIKGGQHKTAVLYGGLNYNTGVDEMQLYAEEFGNREATRSHFAATPDTRGTVWNYLKGTRQEVEQIDPALQKKQYRTTVYTGETGIEESFKALSGHQTGVIHIATHGFYLPEERSAGQSEALRGLAFADTRSTQEDNSLARAGLVFAGANNAWLGRTDLPDGVDDGILTAREISMLDLRGTDLVVMSACQTGLGEVTGEGIFGLQRAFKKAGAQTLIMSLWSVDDQATQAMMTEFYRGLTEGLPRREAFLAAQNRIKTLTFIRNGKPCSGSDPYFWASFVMLD